MEFISRKKLQPFRYKDRHTVQSLNSSGSMAENPSEAANVPILANSGKLKPWQISDIP